MVNVAFVLYSLILHSIIL
uniref:Uncharacterized protein n=1 Tax=Rhizophora mucronata TaxID=61149 RepID=A0A2P2Q155_RHIMU